MGEGKAGIVCLYIQILVFYIQNKILLCWFREGGNDISFLKVNYQRQASEKLAFENSLYCKYYFCPTNKQIIFQNKSLVS